MMSEQLCTPSRAHRQASTPAIAALPWWMQREGVPKSSRRPAAWLAAIANAEVANLKEFEAALAKVDRSKPVNILFRRGEWAQYAVIRPARP